MMVWLFITKGRGTSCPSRCSGKATPHTLFDSMLNDRSARDNLGAHFHVGDLAADLMAANDVTTGANPANGLPMMDDFIDVVGNPFGTDMLNDSWSSGYGPGDFGSNFPCLDFG